MAILYGTQSNGETLPVLVDQFGNLLAKGIEGQQGPPGPPGVGQLPPDPFEGAILGWEDGELAWLGTPVPLPAGTYGPYTYIPGDQRLEIPQDASSLVNGQQLYMSDKDGIAVSSQYLTDTISNVSNLVNGQSGYKLVFPTAYNFDKFEVGEVVQSDWNQSQEWSAGVTGNPYPSGQEFAPIEGFDGNLSTRAQTQDAGGRLTFTPTFALEYSQSVRIAAVGACGQGVPNAYYSLNGGTEIVSNGVDDDWLTLATGSGTIETITARFTAICRAGWHAIEVDGKLLVDPSVSNPDGVKITAIDDTEPSISVDGGEWYGSDGTGDPAGSERISGPEQSGGGSVLLGSDGAIDLRANNGEWVDDYYVTAPEQQIAARKVAANVRKLRKK